MGLLVGSTYAEPKAKDPPKGQAEKTEQLTKAAPKLRVATVQFSETWKPKENAAVICEQIALASKQGADVIHFHEGALSGYGKKILSDKYDWDALREALESVTAAAKEHKIWVLVGSAHRLTPPNKPYNSVYVISPEGKIHDRYDKRYCTDGDLKFHSPGNHFAIFDINGVKCSTLICFDFRFPELYRELFKKGVRVVLQSFHYARRDGPAKRPDINHTVLQGHAICNNMWIAAANCSGGYMRFPGAFITPDAYVEAKLPMDHDETRMMINTVDLAETYRYIWHPSWIPMEMDCANGKLNSGTVVENDPRSDDRQSY
jgi:predicted amidohydrolase